MNLNKFLITDKSGDLEPVNSQFSGIFKKSSIPKDIGSSSSMFLTPKSVSSHINFHHQTSSNSFDSEEPIRKVTKSLNRTENDIFRQISYEYKDCRGTMTYERNRENEFSNVIYYDMNESLLINHHCNLSPEKLGLKLDTNHLPLKKKVGRPKNEEKRFNDSDYLPYQTKHFNHRTKSGRKVKSTPFLFESSQHHNIETKPENFLSLAEAPKKQRQISSEFRCSFCKKIYLGKNKMNTHYKNFPNHRPQSCENESNLFSHLMSIVRKKSTNVERATVFFQEVSAFVQVCEKLTPKLITNQDNITHQQTIDKNAASLFRINPGNYKINMNVFDKSFKIDNPSHDLQADGDLQNESREEHEDISPTIEDQKLSTISSKPMIIIDELPSLDGNECSSLLIKANELTNLTNISLETEDF